MNYFLLGVLELHRAALAWGGEQEGTACRTGTAPLLPFGLCPAAAGCLRKATYCSSRGEPAIWSKLSC